MENFFDWFAAHPNYRNQAWLIIGKGPSYSKLPTFDVKEYYKVSLNHVIRDQKVDIAHIIDSDVVLDCAEEVYSNAGILVMPWCPHYNNTPGTETLDDLIKANSTLSKLSEEGRIKYYHLATGHVKKDNSPVIPTNYFSSEAVVNLLMLVGVRKIRTIGVDGGNKYSEKFKDLNEKTLLKNGHESFDKQFRSIAKKIMMENLDYAPLGVASPVKIYVGSMKEQMLAVKVLEYSIRKNASLPVEVMPLFQGGINIPMPKDDKNKPRTPFSFQRFLIPQLNKFKGLAIYVDSDMQVFTDIKSLWTKEINDAEILSAYETSSAGRRPQYSVMLMDCEKLKWDINQIVSRLDSGELNYEQLMYQMKVAEKIEPIIEKEWNSLEFYEHGKTNLLHYTDMHRQPWLYTNNKNLGVWVRELHESILSGFITWKEVRHNIVEGYVRPSLWIQLKFKRFGQSRFLRVASLTDKFFVPPHTLKPTTSKMKLKMNRIISNIVTSLL